MLFLAGLTAGWALVQREPEPRVSSEPSPPPTTVAAPLPPAEDVPGEDVPGLPRYPDSVRVGYERGERDGLAVIRARYLTTEGLDAVRGFYRGVFQSEEWEEADASFSEDGWTFHVTNGEREATIRISDLGPSVETSIELTEPLPEEPATSRTPEPEPRPAPEPAPEPAPAPAPQYVPPAPAPAPAPGYDLDDDDFGGDDDFGDD
jgi:hypothetical protein